MTSRSGEKVRGFGDPAVLFLFVICAVATLGISTTTPFFALAYAGAIFLCGLWLALRSTQWEELRGAWTFWVPLSAIALWGFLQLALGFTEDRGETFLSAIRMCSFLATALCARLVLSRSQARDWLLTAFAWFGFVVAVTSVLAYYTSEGKVLWVFPSSYPDVWGPFLSRNNFAQFLELVVPASLFLGIRPQRGKVDPRIYLAMAGSMLAAGLASASRAGGILLIAEVVAVIALSDQRARRKLGWFAAAAVVGVGIAGAGTLVGRFADKDPLLDRREIYHSTIAMVRTQPLKGYGLGTFALVYPEFAEYDPGFFVDHAHNDWLEWSADGGVIFTALWAWWAIPLCRAAIRSIWGLGVAAVFLHALVDYPFARHGVAAWVFVLAGALCAEMKKESYS